MRKKKHNITKFETNDLNAIIDVQFIGKRVFCGSDIKGHIIGCGVRRDGSLYFYLYLDELKLIITRNSGEVNFVDSLMEYL